MAGAERVTVKSHLGSVAFGEIVKSVSVASGFEPYACGQASAAIHFGVEFLVDVPDGLPVRMAQQVDRMAGMGEECGRVRVGWADLVLCRDDPDLYAELDGEDGDLGFVAEAICGPPAGGFSAEFREQFESYGSVVIVNSVWVDPVWRGGGIGLIGTGLVLEHLSGAAMGAVLWPMSPQAVGEAQRRSSHAALSRYWSRLGFDPWQGGLYTLDLALTTLSEALDDLTRHSR
jgi:GNAT superfamily N-acetyltransferase